MSSPSSSVLWRSVPLVLAIGIGFAAGRFTTKSLRSEPPPRSAPTKDSVAARGSGHLAKASDNGEGGVGGASPDERWTHWASAPRSPTVERELSATLEEMARREPEHALQLAAQEQNLRSREQLREAALRGWASTAPEAALAAAMKLPGVDNRAAIAAVLQGAAADPEAVVRLGRKITDGADPVALDYGKLAISALAEQGHFQAAVEFAAKGAASNRALWLSEAFGAWAREQPQQSLAALQRVENPGLRHEALQGLVSGWAESDPASLAEHALHALGGDDRTMALGQTLTNWVLRDPAAASQWLSQRESDPSLDAGLSTVATLPTLISQRPEVAAEWAQAISDPQARESALRTIGDEWRRRSPSALQQFLLSNPRLTDADRTALEGR